MVAADVFYGEREIGVLPSTPPTGIPGAKVTEHLFDDVAGTVKQVPLNDQQTGHYTADSTASPDLGPYDAQAEYRTEIEDDQPTPYVLDATTVPTPEAPQGVPATQPSGVDLDVQRTGTDIAFIAVFNLDGGTATETWTNLPVTEVDALGTIADPSPYQAASFTLPGGQAFPTAGTYAVVLYSVARQVPDTSLGGGSGIWVGAGAAVALTVQ